MPDIISWLDSLTHKLIHQRAGNVPVHAEDVVSGAFGFNTGNGNYSFPADLSAAGGAFTITGGKLTWTSATGTNMVTAGAGAGLEFRERTDQTPWVLYSDAGIARLWRSGSGDRFHFESGGRSRHGYGFSGDTLVGPWPADTAYSHIANTNNTIASSSAYGLLISNGGDYCYVGGGEVWFRAKNNGATKAVMLSDGNIEFWNHQGGYKHKFWTDGEYWGNSIGLAGDNGYNAGLVITGGGWIRHMTADIGWHNEARGAGMMGASTFGNQTCTTNNNETTIIARKISQGGWATAGLSSFGESTSMVPYISMHASGCCTTNWRKDSGASYVVDVNSGGGCDWVYAANHPICSERARKRNISVAEEYGLKTIRLLKPHKFQYTPTSEDEIWQWEKWKYDRSIGVWTHPPSEHMGWDDWHVGYFAEEMVNLVPEIVGLHPDGTPKGIDYGNLVVVAIAAINELADKVEDLEAALAGRN